MTHLSSAARLFWATLREIFDEAAYARFLRRTDLPAGREAYAAFCCERESLRARQAKCC